jgi:hypothetical protein
MKRSFLAAAIVLACALPAAAQDFGQQWIDRVTREIQPDRGPLTMRPVAHEIYMGAIGYYDDNLFLKGDDEEEQTVIVPFIRARVDYSERQIDAALDVLGNYKRYIPDEEFSDYEQRGFGRVRYVSPRVSLEIAEILQNVSDPLDVFFLDRVERLVSTTAPRAALEISNVLAIETAANIGYVKFWDEEYEPSDNWNARTDFSVVGHLTNTIDLIGQAGLLAIRYLDSNGPPDTDGYYARGGLRGELTPVILVHALAGWFFAESDDLATGVEVEDEDGLDLAFSLQWQAAQKTTIYADLTRQLAWGAFPEPYSQFSRATMILESTLTQDILGRLRGQWDLLEGALGSRKVFWSLSASATYKLQPQVYLDAGITHRLGEVEDMPGLADYDYTNTIFHLGMVVTN